ncbi:tripartite tricarboxylate transporter substrate binding protein [Variovorax sp. H27-G14]|uniref:Bug family tripartite tricarboxylate transporter substrate binding protein n=1 Tax=Variovorax sp. H27-G14 TaxID=3111914 RepID=UPI0038FC68CD
MTHRRTAITAITLLAALCTLAHTAQGQPAAQAQPSAFPRKAVTIVVPYPAGGSADALIRPVAEKLSRIWGQPVVVDNRTGANGIIATQAVMRAEPDGHTILLHLTGFIQNASLYRKLPYDPFKDLVPVTQLGTQPMGLAVGPASPYTSVSALAAGLKAHAGDVSFGSFGIGSTGHIFGELLKQNMGVQMPHVAYRGEGPMLIDLISGRVSVAFVSSATAAVRQKDQTLRILAVTGPHRLASMQQVPTLSEAGMKGYDLVGWYGFFLPKNTPAAVAERIAADTRTVLAQPDIVQRMRELEIEPSGTSPADFAKLLRSDYAKWDGLIKQFKIELE